ncbi:RidA family protein [Paraburkholderia xenovorans]|uniref:RidA family protein n=1 Tax=Paraburkholderia xenovorans TaxID=36873 RepID=UPI0038B9916F
MEERSAVIPEGHSKPVGRYSPGVSVRTGAAARWVFVSGQVAVDARGSLVGPGDAGRQAIEVFARIEQVLAQARGKLSDLVSLVIYLVNIGDFPAVSAVRNRVLREPAPSSTLVVVSRLVETGCLVEISGVALITPAERYG